MLKSIIKSLPFLKHVFEEREAFRRERNELRVALQNLRMYRDPGHFYSPLPSLPEVVERETELFSKPPDFLPGIEMNTEGQRALLEHLRSFYPEQPFPVEKSTDRRYFLNNPNYSFADGILLYGMIRHLKPARIIEIGSGYSSCAILDVTELFFDNRIECSFIEPHPELFLSLIRDTDKTRLRLHSKPLQDVDDALFTSLEANDILFVDSSHVSKIGSDVNRLFFRILPLLKKGVTIHFHDIPYPFEYPKSWVLEGRAWNEAYMMRAFLEYNQAFTIELFNSYLSHIRAFPSDMTHCLNTRGSGLWLRRQ